MRIKLFPLSLILGLALTSASNGQRLFLLPNLPLDPIRSSMLREDSLTSDVTDTTDWSRNTKPAASEDVTVRKPARLDLTRINEQVVSEFERAWSLVKSGTIDTESVVLLFKKPDGTYIASQARYTNEYRKLTFTWQPNAIAIVHTHPNKSSSKPTDEDRRIADKLKVPIFTITNRGMYMYDPATGKTSMVHKDIDWLNPAKWSRDQIVALNEQ